MNQCPNCGRNIQTTDDTIPVHRPARNHSDTKEVSRATLRTMTCNGSSFGVKASKSDDNPWKQ